MKSKAVNTFALLTCLSLVGGSCGSDANICDELAKTTPTLELGSGSLEFVALSDGDTLETFEGP